MVELKVVSRYLYSMNTQQRVFLAWMLVGMVIVLIIYAALHA
jgi:hypothetical protein